jgi:hypothetical protein
VQRPRRITPKSEAFHIIEGEVDIVVFSDDGALERVVARGAVRSGRSFY